MTKPIQPLLFLFLGINILVLLGKEKLGVAGIKFEVVTVANILLFLFTLIGLLLQIKAASNKNPNAIVRAVMAGMGIKLIGFASAILIYIYLSGKNKSNLSVYVSLGLYFVYTWLEVRLFLKQNPKKNAQS
ncbi:hypothetical protein [Sediminibacterium sp.]|jgi:hypothetical protein|uniref:hypothetical protein n=1 Tax=Sediminibacterium sp. TaxID=1917865 RepID=UPI0025EEBF46|nr:hypothetical protein [Sediminibacterium sp.]MBW0178007.1 hypothetical protein [Sediminibacterium sp.]